MITFMLSVARLEHMDDSAILKRVLQFFEEQIPFNAHLGVKVVECEPGICTVMVPFQPYMVGDPMRPALHGGILSTLADASGGMAVFSTLGRGELGKVKISTVDLRVDYLRRGLLEDIYCDAKIIRAGNRVAVTQMVLHHGDRNRVTADARGVYNVVRPDGK